MLLRKTLSSLRAACVLSALPLTFMAAVPTSAKAANLNFDQIYAFGDSLSDDGKVSAKVFAATGFPFPPPPYYQGRFSNDPLWVEQLATSLGIGLTDVAHAGATTGTDNTLNDSPLLPFFPTGLRPILPAPLPGLQNEIASFAAANPSADPNGLYVVWAGANDYLPTDSTTFTPYSKPDTTIANLTSAVTSLVGVGAKNIMVVNLPNLGQIPLTRNLPQSSDLTALSDLHNTSLAATISGLSKAYSDVNFIPLDVSSLFSDILSNPGNYGFTNVTDACLSKFLECSSNPNKFFFWDQEHPTYAAQKLIANEAYAALSVPEPSEVLGILVIGGFGAVSVLRRKKPVPKG